MTIFDFPITQRFEGWSKRSPEQGQCRCPAHDDAKASLSVGLGDDHASLKLHCQAGCDIKDVLRASGATWSDLFLRSSGNGRTNGYHKARRPVTSGNTLDIDGDDVERKAGGRQSGKIVKVYPYRDASGKLVFEVVRFEPKDFRQRHYTAEGKPIWKGVPENKRPLYRLPELLAAPADATVYLVEGEKDCDRLRASGLIVTTNCGGATSGKDGGKKWLPQYNEMLRGRRVAIIPDSDQSGMNHVRLVAKQLRGEASEVAIVSLPEIPGIDTSKKWDVSDWLDSGGTRQQFMEAVDAAFAAPQIEEPEQAEEPDDSTAERIGNFDDPGMVPVPLAEICSRVVSQCDGWPKRAGSLLFVHDTDRVDRPVRWLEKPSQLWAFVGSKTGLPPVFHRDAGGHTKEEVFHGLIERAEGFDAVETQPHFPPLAGHYYACPTLPDSNGEALNQLLEFFNPATTTDHSLLLCLFSTLFWGGPGGSRPMFLITSDDGRGAGKSTIPMMCGRLAGGTFHAHASEKIEMVKTRMLSPEGMRRRVAVLDNVKTMNFSWGELEGLLTSEVISGKRNFHGEGCRPNTFTWILTINGASLSTDIAQRVVVVKVRKPVYRGDWFETVWEFIDKNRLQIIADIRSHLAGERNPMKRVSRWGLWERSVLALCHDPDSLLDEIRERQAVADVEAEESDDVEAFFRSKLEALRYDTDRECVFIPSPVAAGWFKEVTGDRTASVTTASRRLRQKCEEQAVSRISKCTRHDFGKGFLWTGDFFSGNTHTDLEKRISGESIDYRL